MKLRRLIACLSLLLIAGVPHLRADDCQYRVGLSLKLLDLPPWSFTTYGEFRKTDSHTLHDGMAFWEKLQFDYFTNLTLCVNYTYVDVETTSAKSGLTRWQSTHRAEFEANPHWHVATNVTFRIRNRYEHRWVEVRGTNDRTRHRPELVFETSHLGPLTSIFVNDEVFYDWNLRRPTENRFTPLGLEWRLSKQVSLRTYYFWDHFRSGSQWNDMHVFYTVFDVSLK
ncbi:MAG: DUF2490 domain-containing protein [Verrucomicrobia bacterium]|nr:DUF2490 domain-containing protein [Verrucomicrobiota bacterium]